MFAGNNVRLNGVVYVVAQIVNVMFYITPMGTRVPLLPLHLRVPAQLLLTSSTTRRRSMLSDFFMIRFYITILNERF